MRLLTNILLLCYYCIKRDHITWISLSSSRAIIEPEQIGDVTWERTPTGRGCCWSNEAGHYRAVPEDRYWRFWGDNVTPPRPVPFRTLPHLPAEMCTTKKGGKIQKICNMWIAAFLHLPAVCLVSYISIFIMKLMRWFFSVLRLWSLYLLNMHGKL